MKGLDVSIVKTGVMAYLREGQEGFFFYEIDNACTVLCMSTSGAYCVLV